MDYATFNGIPLTTYGLIGVTTMLLTYSVFRDDSDEKEPEKLPTKESESTKTGFFTSPLGLLTAKPAETETKSIMESTTEGLKSMTESVKEEVGSLTDSLQKNDESPPPPPPVKAVGGKRKRTKRRRDKNKKTKNNRK